MEKQIMQVLDFQKRVNAPLPDSPTLLPLQRANLRQSLLQEEVTEIASATGLFAEGIKDEHETLVEVLDGIIDCIYVLIGTAHEYGLADRLVFAFTEVHESNMTKFGENGVAVFREDGKLLKPDSYRKPNLNQIIKKDLRAFKDMNFLNEIIQQEQDDFIRKTENRISDILAEKNLEEAANWEIYMAIGDEFSDRLSIKYDFSDLLNGRKAVVTIDNEEFTIKENESLVS